MYKYCLFFHFKLNFHHKQKKILFWLIQQQQKNRWHENSCCFFCSDASKMGDKKILYLHKKRLRREEKKQRTWKKCFFFWCFGIFIVTGDDPSQLNFTGNSVYFVAHWIMGYYTSRVLNVKININACVCVTDHMCECVCSLASDVIWCDEMCVWVWSDQQAKQPRKRNGEIERETKKHTNDKQ